MQLRALVLVWLPLVFGACGDPDPESFLTYQECFDDRTMDGMVPVTQAIVACCIDHPIAGTKPSCGPTQPDCINYLTANLKQTSASTTEVMDACAAYVTKMQM